MSQSISYLGYEPSYRTTFRPEEAPEGRRLDDTIDFTLMYGQWRNLDKNTHEPHPANRYESRTDQEWLRQHDNLLLFDNVASRLMLSEGQKQRAKKLFNQLDYRRYQYSKGMGMVTVALVACAYIGCRDGLCCHPNATTRTHGFDEALTEYEVSEKKFKKYFGRFQSDIDRRQNLHGRPFDERTPDLAESEATDGEGGI